MDGGAGDNGGVLVSSHMNNCAQLSTGSAAHLKAASSSQESFCKVSLIAFMK